MQLALHAIRRTPHGYVAWVGSKNDHRRGWDILVPVFGISSSGPLNFDLWKEVQVFVRSSGHHPLLRVKQCRLGPVPMAAEL